MRVVVYDRYPGFGVGNALLFWAWVVGARLQWLLRLADDYYGAESWDDAVSWLKSRPNALSSIQYWGHGNAGNVYNGGYPLPKDALLLLKPKLSAESVIWFRTCSTFQGNAGHNFSKRLADGLGCTVAGHTRLIGLTQGGLHTRAPHTAACWLEREGELPKSWLPGFLRWGPRTITCFRTRIPAGW